VPQKTCLSGRKKKEASRKKEGGLESKNEMATKTAAK